MPRILLLRNPSRALTPVKMDRERWIVLEPAFFDFFSPFLADLCLSRGWLQMGDHRSQPRLYTFFTRRYFDTKWTFMQYPCFYVHVKTRGRGKNIFESFIIKLMPAVDGLRECQEFLEEYVLEISSLLFLSRESLI